ncbi:MULTISPECIES: hypothetical protein [Cellulophaga]|uniref:hypothetical protein n=1 Tax=Cellulophaga TaxID=104264 RepID=UPI0009864E80|nr:MULTISPECIES: hypothetical protein [Cellulophaga]MDO6489862.1 hypothetical protein [Cellulophaga sp. 2_MG-2023]MDO6494944.1 hypothetical protein [Cellulophaga sp. 3_MG-2023]
MKKILVLSILLFSIQSFSQESNDCDDSIVPYWWNGTNSRIEGESPTLRKAFKEIQLTEIEPKNGFITLRLNISKIGNLCDIETFQIDENYKSTEFNNGQLVKELEQIAKGLTNWKRDKDYKTYNLIRLKIKNGRIEEIF